ncbi:homeodomain-like protein, partial [Tanacetum coccineum]
QWRDRNGNISSFSVAKAWEAIRPRGNQAAWSRIVWFSYNIPRHAFHLWLVMRRGLKTHDKMRQWDVRGDTDLNLLRCALCDNYPDSHTHLFFECTFSAKVWSYVRDLDGMDLIPPVLRDILLYLLPMGDKRTAKSFFGKLILSALAYFIWMKRNNRTFKNTRRSPEVIRDLIMVTVRLKLICFRFKNTNVVRQLLKRWKMPNNFRLYGN